MRELVMQCPECEVELDGLADVEPHFLRFHAHQTWRCGTCHLSHQSFAALARHCLQYDHPAAAIVNHQPLARETLPDFLARIQHNVKKSQHHTGTVGESDPESALVSDALSDRSAVEEEKDFETDLEPVSGFDTTLFQAEPPTADEKPLWTGLDESGRASQQVESRRVEKEKDEQLTKPRAQCPFCDQSYKHSATMRRHVRCRHAGEEGTERFRRREGRYRRGKRTPSEFSCRFCSKRFTRKQTWKCHEAAHAGPQVPCPDCGKLFRRREIMLGHLRAVCRRIRRFRCDLCHYGNYHKRRLDEHLIKQHPFGLR